MRVLLLNPPGERTYIRDYFCSKTTKSNYLFHPIDLVVLSGTLASRHEIVVVDAIAERLSIESARERIARFTPDVIVSLVGAVSWNEDRAFLAEESRRGRRVVAIGDVLHERSAERLAREPWIEAAIDDFSSDEILRWLDGEREGLATMTVRRADGSIAPNDGKPRARTYRVPRPRHELFPKKGYQFSFAKKTPFATLLSDYGCPYPCTFCVIGTMGFKTRSLDDVLEEIDSLRERGIHELFFLDQTFGVVKKRGLELCAALEKRGDLSWTTFTRPDTGDDDLFAAMKRAGCHTVILGVESADDHALASYKKGYVVDEVRAGFARAKKHGLRTVGTFIIGLPEESAESLQRTLALALELDLDFMSLNMAVPRFGTEFRRQAIELGLADPDDLVMDQGGEDAFLPTSTLDRETMLALKKQMVRRFYLRPGYLWKQLKSVSSTDELAAHAREGWALLRRNF